MLIYRIFNCSKFDNLFFEDYDARILNVEYFLTQTKTL